MSTYLSRPVWEFPINWNDRPAQSFAYDLRDAQFGFGAPRFERLQSHVVRGWAFSLLLDSEQEIRDVDDFIDALKGRLTGFWFPSPSVAFRIAQGVSGTQFDIVDQNLRDTYSDHPAQYLRFTKDGETAQMAKITAVSLSGSYERVTVDATLSPAVDETWECVLLHYVRLASDVEESQFVAVGKQIRPMRLVELPSEYATAETGTQPIYLYRFFIEFDSTVYWYFTSFSAAIASTLGGAISSQSFSAEPITHGAIRRSTRGASEDVTISSWFEDGNPLIKFLPVPPVRPIWVEIYEAQYATPNDVTLLFKGRVSKVQFSGQAISAKCVSMLDALGRVFPRMLIQPHCNYQVYESNTCKATQASFEKSVTIDLVSSTRCEVSGASISGVAEDHFSYGWIETGTGEDFEIRSITKSTAESGGTVVLTLNAPLQNVTTPQSATIVPGCDGRVGTCKTKFSNFNNFGGHPAVPQRNLALRGLQPETANGNKK